MSECSVQALKWGATCRVANNSTNWLIRDIV